MCQCGYLSQVIVHVWRSEYKFECQTSLKPSTVGDRDRDHWGFSDASVAPGLEKDSVKRECGREREIEQDV